MRTYFNRFCGWVGARLVWAVADRYMIEELQSRQWEVSVAYQRPEHRI